MDRFIFGAYRRYYNTLSNTGYMPDKEVWKLLVLSFYRDYLYGDYRGIVSKDDYHLIERALNCLYGSNCLIPYPDYLKMGKLYLGDMTELSHRVKVLEDTPVLQLSDDAASIIDSDVTVVIEDTEE